MVEAPDAAAGFESDEDEDEDDEDDEEPESDDFEPESDGFESGFESDDDAAAEVDEPLDFAAERESVR